MFNLCSAEAHKLNLLIITFRNNGEVNKEGGKGLHGLSTVKIQDIFVAEDPQV